jgi:hypothetical protein
MQITSSKNLQEVVKNEVYNIDFGTIKKGSDTEVVINFQDVNHAAVSKSCGCTMPTVELLPQGGFNLKIVYDNKKIGVINQHVIEKVITTENKQLTITFNLKGTILA